MAGESAKLKIGIDQNYLFGQLDQTLSKVERSAKIKFNVDERSALLPLGRISGAAGQIGSSFDAANRRVIAFGASVAIVGSTLQVFRNIVTETSKVELSLTKINTALKLNNADLQTFGRGLFDVARQTSQSFDEAAAAAEQFAKQGLSVVDVLKRTKDASILSKDAGRDLTDSVNVITTSLNSFNKQALTSTDIVNKLVAVQTKFGVNAVDLGEALTRVGATAQDAGVGFDRLIGIITAANRITGRELPALGNALRSIFTRIQKPAAIEELDTLGVKVKDLSGAILPADQLLQNLAKSFDRLSIADKQAVSQLAGGTLQINNFKAVISDLGSAYGITQRAQEAAAQATNEADQINKQYGQTLANIATNTKTTFQQIFSNIGNATFKNPLEGILNGFNNGGVAKALEGFSKDPAARNAGEDIAHGIIDGIGNVLGGPGAVIIGATIVKLVGRTAKAALQDISTILGSSQQQLKVYQGIDSLLSRATQLDQQRFAAAKDIAAQETIILELLARQNAIRAASFGANSALYEGLGGGARSQLGGKNSFVPNFADPLNDAIAREKGRGVPSNLIYVDKDSRLVSSSNPQGLLVANRRDEPAGGFQGVDRILSQGVNPIVQGVSGYIPNLALNPDAARILGLNPGNGNKSSDPSAVAKMLNLNSIDILGSNGAKEIGDQFKKSLLEALNLQDSDLKGKVKTSFNKMLGSVLDEVGDQGIANIYSSQKSAQDARIEEATRLDSFKNGPRIDLNSNQPFFTNAAQSLQNSLYKNSIEQKQYEDARELSRKILVNQQTYNPTEPQFSDEEQSGFLSSANLKRKRGGILSENELFATRNDLFTNSAFVKALGSNNFTPQDIQRALAQNPGATARDVDEPFAKILQGNQNLIRKQRFGVGNQVGANNLSSILQGNSTSFNQLSPEHQQLLKSTFTSDAIKKLGFDKYDSGILEKDPKAQEQISNLVQKQIDGLNKSVASALAQASRGSNFQQLQERTDGFFKGLFVNPVNAAEKIINESKSKGAAINAEAADQLRQSAQGLQAQRSGRLQNAALAASFALPFAAGFVPEGESGTTRGQVLGGTRGALEGIGTGAALGSFAGPEGTAIGALVGGIIGALSGALSKATKSVEELADQLNKLDSTNKDNVDSVSKYIQLNQQLDDVLSSNLSRQDKIQAFARIDEQKKQAIANLPQEVQNSLIYGSNNSADLAKVTDKYIKESNISSTINTLGLASEGKDSVDNAGNKLGSLFRGKSTQQLNSLFYQYKSNQINTANTPGDPSAGLLEGANILNKGLPGAIGSLGLDKSRSDALIANLNKFNPEDAAKVLQIAIKKANETVTDFSHIDITDRAKFNAKDLDDKLTGFIDGIQEAQKSSEILFNYGQKVDELRFTAAIGLGFNNGRQSKNLQSLVGQISTKSGKNLGLPIDPESAQNSQQAFRLQQAVDAASFSNKSGINDTVQQLLGVLSNSGAPLGGTLANGENARSALVGLAAKPDQSIKDVFSTLHDVADSIKKSTQENKADKIVNALAKITTQNATLVQLTAIQNQLESVQLKATERSELLTKSGYNPSTLNNFASLSIAARQPGIGRYGAATQANSAIEYENVLDSLGLPRSPNSQKYIDANRKISTSATLSGLLSSTLDRRIGTSDEALTAAAAEARKRGNTELADRTDLAIKAKNFDIKGAREDILNKSSVDDIKKLFESGSLGFENTVELTKLTNIADYTKTAADLLKDILATYPKRGAVPPGLDPDHKPFINKFSSSNLPNVSQIFGTPSTPSSLQTLSTSPGLLSQAGNSSAAIVLADGTVVAPASALTNSNNGTSILSNSTFGNTTVNKDGSINLPPSVSPDGTVKMPAFTTKATDTKNGQPDTPAPLGKDFTTAFANEVKTQAEGLNGLAKIGTQTAQTLESSFSNFWSSFVSGTQKGNQAFRAFAAGIFADLSKSLADDSIKQLFNLAFGGVNNGIGAVQSATGKSGGGAIHLASGGMVPTMLTGGEGYIGPNTASKIGYSNLTRINSGQKLADGGVVKGGSGVTDDVPKMLPQGGFVLNKSAMKRIGTRNFQALTNGQYQKRDAGGFADLDFGFGGYIIPAVLIGAAIGAIADKKNRLQGALIGAGFGLGVGIAGNVASGQGAFGGYQGSPISGDFATQADATNQASLKAATDAVGGGSPISAKSSLISAGLKIGTATGLTEGARLFQHQNKLLDFNGVRANALQLQADTQSDINNRPAGSFVDMTKGANGQYGVIGYAGGTDQTLYTRAGATPYGYADGGTIGGAISPASVAPSSSDPQTAVHVEIHNYGNGSTSSTTNVSNGNGDNPLGTQEFGTKVARYVDAAIKQQLVQQQRTGGILSISRRSSGGSAGSSY